ncbi:hypothetical protein WJX72_011651 [[Myrmecia] bisecta]|uniref:Wings apart-like protein C-terminal domain-containing protein n=1 Tax=[Myrmecia] bisecta TaxID=41462 RepID=A0AAW1PUB4_9CHLO
MKTYSRKDKKTRELVVDFETVRGKGRSSGSSQHSQGRSATESPEDPYFFDLDSQGFQGSEPSSQHDPGFLGQLVAEHKRSFPFSDAADQASDVLPVREVKQSRLSRSSGPNQPAAMPGPNPAVSASTASSRQEEDDAHPFLPQRVLAPPGKLRPAAPVQPKNGSHSSLAKAQESGEQTQMQDDILYALDGLASSSAGSRRESAATLAEVSTTRRGRLGLKRDGMLKEVWTSALGLPLKDDPVLALAFAAMVLAYSREEVNQPLLAAPEMARLMARLLQVTGAAQQASRDVKDMSTARVLRTVQDGPLAKGLPGRQAAVPAAVVLAAIAAATHPQQSTSATDQLKAALREHDVLAQASQLAVSCAASLAARSPEHASTAAIRATDRDMWCLHKCLMVLDNATFACPDNERYLVSLQVSVPPQHCPAEHAERAATGCTAGPSASADPQPAQLTCGLPAWLIQQVGWLGGLQRSGRLLVKDCLQAALAVLMNITHHNDAGCRAAIGAQGLQVTAQLIGRVGGRSGQLLTPEKVSDRARMLEAIDIVSVALGLLINLVENNVECRAELVKVEMPEPSGSESGSQGDGQQQNGMVAFLCRLVQVMGASGKAAPVSPLFKHPSDEVTEQQLADSEEDGTAAILEAYAAVLLGFLLERDLSLRPVAAALMPEGSLDPVISAIHRCLQFYVQTGSITQQTEASLRNLLTTLEQDR